MLEIYGEWHLHIQLNVRTRMKKRENITKSNREECQKQSLRFFLQSLQLMKEYYSNYSHQHSERAALHTTNSLRINKIN